LVPPDRSTWWYREDHVSIVVRCFRPASAIIALFTDFGADDIYVAQVKAALLEHLCVDTPIVDLLHGVQNFELRAGAHLLAALQGRFPVGTVFLAVVDPEVGTTRDVVIVQADGKWFAGPAKRLAVGDCRSRHPNAGLARGVASADVIGVVPRTRSVRAGRRLHCARPALFGSDAAPDIC
jgi:hypothetical protein